MRAASLAIACAATCACAEPAPQPATGSLPTSIVTVTSPPSAAPPAPVASSEALAAPAAPTPFAFVSEVPAGSMTALFPLASGVALFASTDKGWTLRVARGSDPLSEVAALRGVPESRSPEEALFAGEIPRKELWLSVLIESGFPALDFVTFRVSGTAVQRVRGKWYRALAKLDGGDVVALPSSENPAYLADGAPQKFERVTGRAAKLVAIPAELRLYDVDVLASGEVHALAAHTTDAGMSIVAWIAPPGGAPRTLALPDEIGNEQPKLVRGTASFLAVAEGKGAWMAERDGRLVVVRKSASFESEAAAPGGDVWFADQSAQKEPRLWRARLDLANGAPLDAAAVPLPTGSDLRAAGADDDCRDLGYIERIVALDDGTVWLDVNCLNGAHAILRGRSR